MGSCQLPVHEFSFRWWFSYGSIVSLVTLLVRTMLSLLLCGRRKVYLDPIMGTKYSVRKYVSRDTFVGKPALPPVSSVDSFLDTVGVDTYEDTPMLKSQRQKVVYK